MAEMRDIAQYSKIARGAARQVLNGRHEYLLDDGEQEALISIWTELAKGEEISDSLAYTIARRRCLNLVKDAAGDNQFTGHERSVTFSSSARHVSLDALAAALGSDSQYLGTTDAVDPLGVAVRQSLRAVPQETREYVFARFWEDADDARLSEVTGLTSSGNRRAWKTRHKAALTAALADLNGPRAKSARSRHAYGCSCGPCHSKAAA